MKESEGTFSQPYPQGWLPCPNCKDYTVECRIWNSKCGGYEDFKYTCTGCAHVWWVDGSDS